ncbi:unnamed protein product [Pleuronectes platessa]|uniref:Uncharacterized protein n=1 Tax=Pleuronectes platessa TaxID=8262 RepID=A0A9N7TTE6_PLEPL|nr:unnamed protein product [Pleuronectes platessa]
MSGGEWKQAGCMRPCVLDVRADKQTLHKSPKYSISINVGLVPCGVIGKYLLAKVAISTLPTPGMTSVYPGACPRSPHAPHNSCWKRVCVTGPLGGSQQGLEAVKSRPPQPWTAPPLSQSQRGKDLNLE